MAETICIIRNSPSGVFYETSPPPLPAPNSNTTTQRWTKKILTYALLKGTVDIPIQHEITTGMRLTVQTWQDEIPINFVQVKGIQNPDITFQWVDGNTDPVIKGDNGIMGYSRIPDGLNNPIHIILNDSLNWSFSGTNFQWNPLNTMLHEMGHSLGLPHDPNPAAVMFWTYNGKIMLGPTDKAAIQAIYGVRTFSTGAYLRLTQAVYTWKLRLK